MARRRSKPAESEKAAVPDKAAAPDPIVSRRSVEALVKERIARRPSIDATAVTKLINAIDQLALRLATGAADLSLRAGRKQIQDEDVDAAYRALAGDVINPDSVFTAIEKLDTDQLRDLVLTISSWLKEKQPGRRS